MAATNDPVVRVGEILADKFRVEREIGRGGMGVVVAATHLKLDEPVALKLMLPEFAQKPDVVERFTREARAASKIKSPHVVRVVDVDTLPSGAPYMVLELLDGFTLSQLSRATGPLDPATAAAYVVQACDAIAEAHDLGIIHRDLKPSNLFVARDRDGAACVKVLDFGISKVAPVMGGAEITHTDQLLGSPTYMSPEQLRSSRNVDGRTDIWSLGVVLYQCLTRSSPFHADTMPQVLVRVMADEPKPPRQLRPELPEGLEQVILRCMEKDPERRFRSARELATALAPFALAGPVPWPNVTIEGSLPAASVRSALRALNPMKAGSAMDGGEGAVEWSSISNARATAEVGDKESATRTQDVQAGWGSTLGANAAGSRRKWYVVAAAAVVVVGSAGAVSAIGMLDEAGSGNDHQASSQPGAADPEAATRGTDAVAAEAASPLPTNDLSAASTSEAHIGDGGLPPSDAAPSTAAPRPPARTRPAKPPTQRPAATTPDSKVDPFGKSRQ